jgi:hypothetical protein
MISALKSFYAGDSVEMFLAPLVNVPNLLGRILWRRENPRDIHL